MKKKIMMLTSIVILLFIVGTLYVYKNFYEINLAPFNYSFEGIIVDSPNNKYQFRIKKWYNLYEDKFIIIESYIKKQNKNIYIKKGIRMRKREIFMLSSLAFSVGTIFGFLISPMKQGIIVISNNTANNNWDKRNSTTDES